MTNTPLSHSDSISPLPPLKYSLQRRIRLILSGVLISLILLISPPLIWVAIAHDIQDELGQTLTTLKLNLYILRQTIPENEHLASAQQLATEAQEKARTLSHELRPAMLDDLGLQPTLNWLIDRQKARPIS